MPYKKLTKFYYYQTFRLGRKLSSLYIAKVGDQWLLKDEKNIARAICKHFGFIMVHRQYLRPSPYRNALKIKLRSGTYGLFSSERHPVEFLLSKYLDRAKQVCLNS